MEPVVTTERSSQSSPASPWALLPPELVGEIAGHLRDATDFVRFHAVCRPWREAVPSLLSPVASRPRFLPWLLMASPTLLSYLPMNLLSPGKTLGYPYGCDGVDLPSASSTFPRKWVASTDGKAAWLFKGHPEPKLVDCLTGEVTPLPGFHVDDKTKRRMENFRGIVYGDGTIFMYSFVRDGLGINYPLAFTAAILRPGDKAWTVVEKSLAWKTSYLSSAAYHDGKILVCMEVHYWLLLTPDFQRDGDLRDARLETNHTQYRNYMFESHGELLRATILEKKEYSPIVHSWPDDPTRPLSVVVHAMEGVDGDGNMRWVARDGQSFINHVLFLGSPASFTVNAAHLGMAGGCAYFVFSTYVYKYSLIDRETKLMERLRPWWYSDMVYIWLQPCPTFSPVHKLRATPEFTEKKKEEELPA